MEQHKKKSKLLIYGSYAIIIILVISFIGATILTSGFNNQQSRIPEFGKYGSQIIKYSEYNMFGRFVESNIYNLEQQYPQAKGSSILVQQAWQQAFNQTVLVYALLDLANKAGVQISDERVKELITTSPEFTDEEGAFNQKLYTNIDKNIKESIIDFKVNYEKAQKIQQDIVDTPYISSKEVEFFKTLNDKKRAFNFVKFDRNKLKDNTLLVEYGKSHKDLFKKIHFLSITLDSKAEAESVYNKIINNESSFEDSISVSIDSAKDNNGDRGLSYAYQIKNTEGEQVLDALLALKDTNSISEIVETETGNFAIYKLSKEIEDADLQIQDTLTDIQEYLQTYDSAIVDDEINSYATQFIKQAKSLGFDNAARNSDLEIGKIPLAPLNVDNVSVLDSIESEEEIATLVNSDDVLSDIFSLELKEVSNPYPLGSFLYIFQNTDISNRQTDNTVDKNRLSRFIDSENIKNLRNAVVVKEKLTDNFSKVFSSLN